nr:hypothetical protein [Tanacetum cinerariifolium]
YSAATRFFGGVTSTPDEQMFDADQDLHGEEVTTTVTTPTISLDEATLAQTLAKLKHAKPKTKAKGIVFHKPKESTTTTAIPKIKSQVKDKHKAKMIEEPMKLKKKDQIQLDKEVALKLQEELQVGFQKEQRLEKEHDKLTDAEKAKLFMEFLEKRRKFFATKRAKEKRNRPPTKSQQRNIMSTYLKNMDGWKLSSLKKKSFAKIQELFDKAMKKVNTFVDFRTELAEESSKKSKAEITQEGCSKRERDELEQAISKKQKVKDDKELEELKKCLEIIPDDGDHVTIDAISLSSMSPTIVDYKIYQEGKKSYF